MSPTKRIEIAAPDPEESYHHKENPKKRHQRIPRRKNNSCYLIGSVVTVVLPAITVGSLLGMENFFTMKNDSNTFSVPFLHIGAIIGAIIASIVMDRHGRHICLWCLFWFIYLPILVNYLTSDITVACIMRFLAGLSVGAYYQVVPIYIAELTYRRHRGKNLTVLYFLIFCGILRTEDWFTMWWLQIVDLICLIAFIIMKIFLAPETPYYHMAKNNFDEAMRILERCRTTDWHSEIREIGLDIAAYPRDVSNCLSFALSFTELNVDFLHRTVLAIGLLLLSQGVYVPFYIELIRYASINHQWWLIILSLILQIIAFGIKMCVIDRHGRRVLLFISSVGVAVFYLMHFALLCGGYEAGTTAINAVRETICFFFSLGLDVIPILYMAESMPYTIRASAVAFFLLFYFIAKAVMPLINFYGEVFLYSALLPLMYFLVALATVFFSWFIPPETKQLSLVAIQIKLDHDVSVLEKKLISK